MKMDVTPHNAGEIVRLLLRPKDQDNDDHGDANDDESDSEDNSFQSDFVVNGCSTILRIQLGIVRIQEPTR